MKKRNTKRPAKKSSERTVAVISGLKVGDPSRLAPQPCALANVAFELGRVDRKTFLAEAGKAIRTKQVIGRLFSFHKQELIDGGFIKFEKVPKSRWKADLERRGATTAAPTLAPEEAAGTVAPV